MAETRRTYDSALREGAIRLVRGTGRPVAQGAGDSRINAGALSNGLDVGHGGALPPRAARRVLTAEAARFVPVPRGGSYGWPKITADRNGPAGCTWTAPAFCVLVGALELRACPRRPYREGQPEGQGEIHITLALAHQDRTVNSLWP